MSLINIKEQNYDELVKEGLVLVDFYADWCGPCKILAPALEALSNTRDDLKIIKVNVDEQEDLARRFSVMSVPTLLLYKDNNLLDKRTGFHTLDMLNEWISDTVK
ncbi:MAG: thioredoxin [Bacilli bacterium]|nr:thioredoxin [Bacilli bacterium]MDD3305013.1 thioredoxin [Bacilli bacterium]MDD4053656.1 thioredoxin [Bacilli bacterium]MDD4411155.1 thioredoxin [Bacilli bacterium]